MADQTASSSGRQVTEPPRADGKAPDHESIAQRAYELYCEWEREDGHDLAHWFEAERQLKVATVGPAARERQAEATA